MQADLFPPRDVAALLSLRAALGERRVSTQDLLDAFRAAGLMSEDDAAAPSTDEHVRRAA